MSRSRKSARGRGRGRAAQPAQHSPVLSPVLAVVGVVAGVFLTLAANLPGAMVTWAMFTAAGFMHPTAELTGRKDKSGYATAAHAGEEKALRRYRFWSDLKWRMFSPNPDWWVGWPVYASSVLAVVVAATAAHFDNLFAPASALFAFVTVMQVSASRRRNSTSGEPCPGTRFGDVRKLTDHWLGFVWRAAAGAVAGVAVAYVLSFAPFMGDLRDDHVGWGMFAVLGALMVCLRFWSGYALEHWRVVVAAREEWKPRWEMLKQDPAPHLVDRQEIGPMIVDIFDAPGSVGAATFDAMAPRILPTIGTNTQVFILPTENLDKDGQPIPLSRHPLRFRVVTTTSDGMPDITDPTLDSAVVKAAIEIAVVGGCIGLGAAAPFIGEVSLISTTPEPGDDGGDVDGFGADDEEFEATLRGLPPELADELRADRARMMEQSAPAPEVTGPDVAETPPAAWMVEVLTPNGPPLKWMHDDLEGMVAGTFGCEAVFDHRNYGRLFIGVLEGQSFVDVSQMAQPLRACSGVEEALHRVSVEDHWIGVWTNALKVTVNFPMVEHSTYKEMSLRDGTTVYSQSFVTLRGDDVAGNYFNLESKLATALEHKPFVATTGFLTSSQRRGERHEQAFTVLWADSKVPANPDKLPPPANAGQMPEAQHAVLRGRVNEAFKAARLAQPEVFEVQPMTAPRSVGHIWKIKVRLYGGVTLADVRAAQQRLKQAWGSNWLRVTETPTGDGVVIVAGANPARITPRDETVAAELTSLDWEQAWLDANARGVGGVTPKLTKVDHLPSNEKVQVLDFELPSGLSLEEVRQAKKKLMATTANAFVDIRPHPDNNPAHVQMLACVENPMPYPVSYDFEYADSLDQIIPFATGVDGKPVEVDVKESPHLLLLGLSGSGKSVAAQNLMYGALVQGFQVAVIDIQKQGADFKFAEDRCVAFARDVPEAVATMEAVYDEVKRRAKISGQLGKGHVREWDEPPPPIVVFIDEFKGVLMAGKKPSARAEENPDLEKARLEAVRNYEQKKRIGFLTGRIAAEARSADVHLFLMTQKLVASDLDDEIKDLRTNLARILLGKASNGDRMSALRDPFNAPDLGEYIPKGRGLWESVENLAEAVQFWYTPTDEYRRNLVARVPEVAEGDRLELSKYMVADLEDEQVAFSVVSRKRAVPVDEDVELESMSLDLSDLDGVDDEGDVDLSALGIQIIDDDDDDDDDGGDGVGDVGGGDVLDWGDDGSSVEVDEFDWDAPAVPLDDDALFEQVAPAGLSGRVGLHELVDVNVQVGDSMFGWPPADAFMEMLERHPAIESVWTDDLTLSLMVDGEVSRSDLLVSVAAEAGVEFEFVEDDSEDDFLDGAFEGLVVSSVGPDMTDDMQEGLSDGPDEGDVPDLFATPEPEPEPEPEPRPAPSRIIPVPPPDPSNLTEDF